MNTTNGKTYWRAAGLMVAASTMIGLPAFCQVEAEVQASPGAEERTLGTIIVTAQKREQSLLEVPQTVQAVTSEELEAAGISTLRDAIQLIPSATETGKFSPGTSAFQIRSTASSETDGDATIGYYLDNFAYSVIGRPYAPVAEFYDANRVEILRGPSGTLYGLGSLGGTIKVLTNDPDLDNFSGSVKAGYSSMKDAGENYSADGMINIPLVPGKLAVRGVASYRELGGWIGNQFDGARNVNESEVVSGRLKILAEPTDKLSLKLSYFYNNVEHDYASRAVALNPSRTNRSSGESPSEYETLIADIEYDLGFATLMSTTGKLKGSIGQFSAGVNPPPTGRFNSVFPLEFETFNEDLRLVSNLGGNFEFVVGAFYQDGHTTGGQNVELIDLGIALGNDNTLESKSWAIYGEGTYGFGDGLFDLTLGGRYFREKRTFNQNSSLTIISTGAVTPTIGVTEAETDTFNPRVNLALNISDDAIIYAEASKGFRSGSITSSALISAANLVLGTNFNPSSPPDSLWNYQVGSKWQLFNRTLNLEAAAYYYDWSNAQIELFPASTSIIVPVGDVSAKGLDVTLSWLTPIEGLSLNAAGNVNSTELENVPATLTAALPFVRNGNQLPGSSKRTLSLIANYERPLEGTDWTLAASAKFSYRDRQQSIFNGAYAPSHEFYSARISMSNDDWRISLFGDNLTNFDEPLNRASGTFLVSTPRTFGIEIERSF